MMKKRIIILSGIKYKVKSTPKVKANLCAALHKNLCKECLGMLSGIWSCINKTLLLCFNMGGNFTIQKCYWFIYYLFQYWNCHKAALQKSRCRHQWDDGGKQNLASLHEEKSLRRTLRGHQTLLGTPMLVHLEETHDDPRRTWKSLQTITSNQFGVRP